MVMYTLSYIKDPLPVVSISGISGVGKTTLINSLLESYPEYFELPLSYTTRSRRENDKNYLYVDEERIKTLYSQGKIINLDFAYGNYYGISRQSLKDIIDRGKMAIKEIHPSNLKSLKSIVPNLICVLIENKNFEYTSTSFLHRDNRIEDDSSWMNNSEFDFIINVNGSNEIEVCTLFVKKLLAYRYHLTKYDSPYRVAIQNKEGYDRIAAEFYDSLRVTTKVFHDISINFWNDFFEKYEVLSSSGNKILEIGPGNGWLLNGRPYFDCEIASYDISSKMKGSKGQSIYIGTSRSMPFPANYFDFIISSLADPFLIPEVIIEIERLLKPGGVVALTYPSREWARNLPSRTNISMTVFSRSDGENINVYSFCDFLNDLMALSFISKLKPISVSEIYCNDDNLPSTILNAFEHSKNSNLPLMTTIILENDKL